MSITGTTAANVFSTHEAKGDPRVWDVVALAHDPWKYDILIRELNGDPVARKQVLAILMELFASEVKAEEGVQAGILDVLVFLLTRNIAADDETKTVSGDAGGDKSKDHSPQQLKREMVAALARLCCFATGRNAL